MAVTLASNYIPAVSQSRLALLVGDELVASLVLSLTLGVIPRGPVGSEHSPRLTATTIACGSERVHSLTLPSVAEHTGLLCQGTALRCWR